MKLLIYCAGGLGREIYDMAHRINQIEKTWSSIEFIDDQLGSKMYYKTKSKSFEETVRTYKPDEVECVVAIGEPEYREILYNDLSSKGFRFTTLIDPSAIVSVTAIIGAGSIIGNNAFVSSQVQIGINSLIQQNVVTGHDSIIEAHSILSAGSFLGGMAKVGSKTFIGSNVAIKERISIGSQTIIGIGSVVINNVPDCVVAAGNPSIVIKSNNSKRVF